MRDAGSDRASRRVRGSRIPHPLSRIPSRMSNLDGAGIAKLGTLEEAMAGVQRLHGLIEQFAMAQKRRTSTQHYGLQIRRAASPLVGLLKGQFGAISDQVAQLILVATRGGNEQMKVRSLRENVAMLRTQIEIAQKKVREQHSVPEAGDAQQGEE